MTKAKKIIYTIDVIFILISSLAIFFSWIDVINFFIYLSKLNESYPKLSGFVFLILTNLLPLFFTEWISNKTEKTKMKKKAEEEKAEMRRHFPHSLEIVQKHIIPTIKHKVAQTNDYNDNNAIDNFIQSPLEYVNETLRGNKLPEFDPNDTYQDAIFEDEIKYIVAITAENPNLFLNPSIGFYMSNCYAVSIIRHLQDFIKKTKHTQNSKFQLDVKDIKAYNNVIKPQIRQVINTLKDEKKRLETFEFIRFFIFDEHQNECCKDAIFPSLKASQDLFRTISFYIQKKELEESLGNNDNKWEEFREISNALWDLIGTKCKNNPCAMENLERRKVNVIPEFLLVFYDNKIAIHTYLGGKHYSWDSKEDLRPEEKDKAEEKIRLFTKLLADYVSKGQNGQLKIDQGKINQNHTFIDWKWSSKSDDREQYFDFQKKRNRKK